MLALRHRPVGLARGELLIQIQLEHSFNFLWTEEPIDLGVLVLRLLSIARPLDYLLHFFHFQIEVFHEFILSHGLGPEEYLFDYVIAARSELAHELIDCHDRAALAEEEVHESLVIELVKYLIQAFLEGVDARLVQ